MSANFNAANDYFGLGSTKFEVVSSGDGHANQMAELPDSLGDVSTRDTYGETWAPTATYKILRAITASDLPALGELKTISGISGKVAVESISISTSQGAAPTLTIVGKYAGTQTSAFRTYALGTLSVSPRHRAQSFTSSTAPSTLTSSTKTWSVQLTPTDPKGVVKFLDAHGGKVETSCTHQGAPVTAPEGCTGVVSRTDPENGYTETSYTTTSDLTGTEVTVATT